MKGRRGCLQERMSDPTLPMYDMLDGKVPFDPSLPEKYLDHMGYYTVRCMFWSGTVEALEWFERRLMSIDPEWVGGVIHRAVWCEKQPEEDIIRAYKEEKVLNDVGLHKFFERQGRKYVGFRDLLGSGYIAPNERTLGFLLERCKARDPLQVRNIYLEHRYLCSGVEALFLGFRQKWNIPEYKPRWSPEGLRELEKILGTKQ